MPARIRSYGLAVLFTAGALGITLLAEPVLRRSLFPFFFVAVSLTAWLAGLGPAILAIGLSVVALALAFFSPGHTFAGLTAANNLPLLVFAATNGLIVALIELLRRSERRFRALAAELEIQVRESQALHEALNRLTSEAMEARRHAEVANRAKTDFLASMSHELRTPLNAIAGYSELLEMGIHGDLTEPQLESIRRVRRSGRHLQGLVEQVLSFAKIEAGKLELSLGDVMLDGVLSRVGELIAPQAAAKGIAYTYGGCDPAITVHADVERVEQIIINLLTNAVKYTEPGGWAKLTVAPEARLVSISVSDCGPGVPEDRIQTVFEPFVQLPLGKHATSSGIGLGLAISRDLARAMGGDVAVTSQLGVGSTFTLRLSRVGIGSA